ncbi:MAG TPA: D-glycero-beta-D-manno-heptose-7-phosphate kinase [Vicinamibacterales bacterium]|nr:D-glycero-beta-D-manno-heptose-7-phosphate kinase [Vicinamibacterales bacterium]
MTAATDLLSRLQGRTLLVVGDLMLDHFVVGAVDRISPEAPVPVVRFDHESFRLGGAANVAHNAAALGARVQLVGVAGEDDTGGLIRAELAKLGIDSSGVVSDPKRRTTRKLRVVTSRNQQVARIDYEDDREVHGNVEAAIVSRIEQVSASADAILISDYLKGAVSRGVAAGAIEAAKRRDIPLLVDPKVPHIDYYAGAAVITPNHHEAEAVTLMRIRTGEEAIAAARRFRERVQCDCVLITRGEHGMTLLGSDVEAQLAAEAREVADVTGAGDTVVATMALALAAGASLIDAARLANRAASIVVGKFGPATVSIGELENG